MISEHDLLKNGLLICLSGPSGVGKGTVIDVLKKSGTQLEHSVSITTRVPRIGEVEGISYYFRTREEFLDLKQKGEILESDEYCGNLYGTPKSPIIDRMNNGIDVIMDVTVAGSLETIANFPDAISIFLLPPSFTELKRRLVGRKTETEDVIEKRMKQAVYEVSQAPRFNYIIVNENINDTASMINKILDTERHRSTRLKGIDQLILQI